MNGQRHAGEPHVERVEIRQVGEDAVELAAGAGTLDVLDAGGQLVHRQPPDGHVLAELPERSLALVVRQASLAHANDYRDRDIRSLRLGEERAAELDIAVLEGPLDALSRVGQERLNLARRDPTRVE